MITDKNIDSGKGFDFGRTSEDYAKYRDIYPDEFYEKIHSLDICKKNQKVLDLGTGTGVIPRNMYKYGAKFTGTDIAENQIKQAKLLAQKENMDIDFFVSSAEDIDFPENSFDVITACQCFFYFNHDILAPKVNKLLTENGRFAVMYMAWLPHEDKIAGASEELVLKYNPGWTGSGETRHDINVPDVYNDMFITERSCFFDVFIPFTKESWNGRIRACRGIGASLTDIEVENFNAEHIKLLNDTAPDNFEILHYCAISVLKKKS